MNIKSYTDLEQSKKLAEILPIESADSHYVRNTHDFMGNPVDGKWSHPKYGNPNSRYANYIVQNFSSYETIPCWSLAALLSVLPTVEGFKPVIDLDINQILYEGTYRDTLRVNNANLIDGAFEMVLKLKENNKL